MREGVFRTPARFTRWSLPLVAGAMLAAALPIITADPAVLQVALSVILFGALGSAWNLVGGFLGRVSFGHGAFIGIGAYTTLLLLTRAGVTPWLGIPAGAVLAAAFAWTIGRPTLRLFGHYFAMATIAVLEITRLAALNWNWAGGAMGVEAPVRASAWTMTFIDKRVYYGITLGMAVATHAICAWVTQRRAGYYWRATSGHEDAARSLGVPVERYKLRAFVLSAALTGLWGGFFGVYVGFVDPDSAFSLSMSVQIVLVVILGGVGTLGGPWLGAALLVPLAEGTRVWLGTSGKGLDLLIYGLAILLVSLYRPQGVLSLFGRGMAKDERR